MMNFQKKVKRIVCLAAAFASMFGGAAYAAPSTSAKTYSAKSYVLIEASTGRVLTSGNPNEKLPMASTTKIMTCILAIENGNLDDVVTVKKEAVGLEGTSIYLREGEKITLHDLVYGLMMASGNDAAAMIAIHIGGSIKDFAQMMNAKAKEIGALNTNFVTPNGLPNDNHYTTAYDLALISAYAMKNATFRQIVSTKSLNLPQDTDSPARYLRSRNKILYQFDGGNGIKTGYTKKAGKCLSAGAYKNNMQLIAVVLNDPDMFEDCKTLLSYGFDNYKMTLVAKKGDEYGVIKVKNGIVDSVNVELDSDIRLPLTAEEVTMVEKKINIDGELVAPVKAGTQVGTVEFWLDGKKYGEAALKTTSDVLENTYLYNLWRILNRWMGVPGWRNSADSEIFSSGGGRIPAQS